MIRKTTRHLEFPESTTVLPHRWPGPKGQPRVFRAVNITETLEQGTDDERWGAGVTYTVEVSGPVQTAKGNDHGANGGKRCYGSHRMADGKLDELPAELAVLLLGAERMATAEMPQPQKG